MGGRLPSVHDLGSQAQALLAAYFPTPDEVAPYERMMVLLASAGDVFAEDHYVPGHFTASGVVASEDLSRVVLVDHAKLGVWLQPGGHFEPGDPSPDAAARREIAEECGVDRLVSRGLFDIDVHDIPARPGAPAHAHFDLRFLFTTDQRRIAALDGVVEARWMPVGGSIERLGSSVQRLLDKVAAGG